MTACELPFEVGEGFDDGGCLEGPVTAATFVWFKMPADLSA